MSQEELDAEEIVERDPVAAFAIGYAAIRKAFDELRQLRNQSEYDALLLRADDVTDAPARADAIIDAVDKHM